MQRAKSDPPLLEPHQADGNSPDGLSEYMPYGMSCHLFGQRLARSTPWFELSHAQNSSFCMFVGRCSLSHIQAGRHHHIKHTLLWCITEQVQQVIVTRATCKVAEPLQGLVEQRQLVEQHVMCPVCHELVRRQAGTSKADVATIIAAGRIPLLLTDAEGAQQARSASKGCMTLFLAPVSAEVGLALAAVHEQGMSLLLTDVGRA